jgi:hypothetical protein
VKVSLDPGAKVKPARASVWIACDLLDASSATMFPLGVTTKNSEIFETDPMATLGTHPPLTLEVEVSETRWKSTVAFPVFLTVTLSMFCVKAAPMIWKRVMS